MLQYFQDWLPLFTTPTHPNLVTDLVYFLRFLSKCFSTPIARMKGAVPVAHLFFCLGVFYDFPSKTTVKELCESGGKVEQR